MLMAKTRSSLMLGLQGEIHPAGKAPSLASVLLSHGERVCKGCVWWIGRTCKDGKSHENHWLFPRGDEAEGVPSVPVTGLTGTSL